MNAPIRNYCGVCGCRIRQVDLDGTRTVWIHDDPAYHPFAPGNVHAATPSDLDDQDGEQ